MKHEKPGIARMTGLGGREAYLGTISDFDEVQLLYVYAFRHLEIHQSPHFDYLRVSSGIKGGQKERKVNQLIQRPYSLPHLIKNAIQVPSYAWKQWKTFLISKYLVCLLHMQMQGQEGPF